MKIHKPVSFTMGAILLALPNMFQNLITNLAALIDNLMVGGLGNHAIAGVTIVNQIVFIIAVIMFGIGGTAGIFMPQFKGSGDEEKMTEVFKISLLFAAGFGFLFFLIMTFMPDIILRYFAQDPQTLYEAHAYLRYIRFTLLVQPMSFAIASGFRFSGLVKIPMYLAFLAVSVNTFLNYVLIHGNLGFPALGVRGAAIGTLIARIIELVIFLILMKYINSPVKLIGRLFLKLDTALLKSFINKGSSLILNEFFWAFGLQTLTVIYTMRLSDNIAAMSISSTFSKLLWAGMGGVSVVVSLYLGEHLGRGDFKAAKVDARRLKKLSSLLGICLGVFVFLISLVLIGFYNVSPDILRAGRILLMINISFSWLHYLNMGYYSIFRAGGDTFGVLLIDSGFMWAVALPLAFIIGRFGFVIYLHFFLIQFLEFIKLGVAHHIYGKGKWLNNLTQPSTKSLASEGA